MACAALLLSVMAGGCGKPQAPSEPPPRSRDKRGATPQETVGLVKEALERRRYRDVLLHLVEEDHGVFAVARYQALLAFAEGLGDEESGRRAGLLQGLGELIRVYRLDEARLRRGDADAMDDADPASVMDRLGALGAANAVDGLGGFADLVPAFRDWQIEGDQATALAGEEPATERFTFRRVNGAWYYVARE